MALKPIPRFILIGTVVAATIFGVVKFVLPNVQKNENQVSQVENKKQILKAEVSNPSTGNSFQKIVDSGVVKVSVQSPSKPFYSEDGGRAQGFNVDFMEILFSKGDFTQKHSVIKVDTSRSVDTYEDVPKALLTSNVDMAIDGLTFSDNDLPGVVYSIPYIEDFGYSLITSKDTMMRSVEDINEMTIGVLKGDPDVKNYVTKRFPSAKIVELSDESINGERAWINFFIKKGKVDAIIYDYPFAVAEIKGTDLQFAVSKLPGSDIKYKIAVRKSDVQLLDQINFSIRKAKNSPEYSELIKKYFMSTNVAAAKSATKSESLYMVKKGDTLAAIAGATLGDKMRYQEIESRNNLPNPNLITVGQKLVIPKV